METPTTLPEWPLRTIAVLATVDEAPHAIPVSAPVRASDRSILLSLHRSRDSLARLRDRPQVALVVLAEGNVAFTARGTASVIEEPMTGAPDYAAVEIEVAEVDDHRQPAFTVEAGVDRNWIDEDEKRALGERVKTLQQFATPVSTPRGTSR
jgi:Pyridoxamine 5'-phosphate oxidase